MTPELEKKIADAADADFIVGKTRPVGTRERYLYEEKRESFLNGVSFGRKGMYTEEEVLALFENWLNTKINEELMVISGELDCLEGVTFSDWFEQNKKK